MTARSILVASLPTGPRHPLSGTPPRSRGSVRRTTTIDQRRGDMGEPTVVVAAGRDLLTRDDGTTVVVDEVSLRVAIDATGHIAEIETVPPVPAVASLIGVHASQGFRRRLDETLASHRTGSTVLHQLLDDLPMSALISRYGSAREMDDDWQIPQNSAEGLADLCAGWERGATMLGTLESTGIFPIPVGPPAPDLSSAEDPLAWHDMEPMAPRSVRRRRRLDLTAGEGLSLDVHFRDSHMGLDGAEDVLHEYTLAATLDPHDLVVLSSEAVAHTLPWPECPRALASAGRIVGEAVADLPRKVRTEFSGVTTCTHLNDVLRSLAGVVPLAAALAR